MKRGQGILMVSIFTAGLLAAGMPGHAETEDSAPEHRKGGSGKHGMHEGPWMSLLSGEGRLAEKLGLDEDQKTAIKAIAEKHKEEFKTLQKDLIAAGIEQAKLMTAESLDESALLSAVEKTGGIRTDMAKLRIKVLLEVRQILKAGQIEEIQNMLKENFRDRADKRRGERMKKRAKARTDQQAGEGSGDEEDAEE